MVQAQSCCPKLLLDRKAMLVLRSQKVKPAVAFKGKKQRRKARQERQRKACDNTARLNKAASAQSKLSPLCVSTEMSSSNSLKNDRNQNNVKPSKKQKLIVRLDLSGGDCPAAAVK